MQCVVLKLFHSRSCGGDWWEILMMDVCRSEQDTWAACAFIRGLILSKEKTYSSYADSGSSFWGMKTDMVMLNSDCVLSVGVIWPAWTVIRRHDISFLGLILIVSLRGQKKWWGKRLNWRRQRKEFWVWHGSIPNIICLWVIAEVGDRDVLCVCIYVYTWDLDVSE